MTTKQLQLYNETYTELEKNTPYRLTTEEFTTNITLNAQTNKYTIQKKHKSSNTVHSYIQIQFKEELNHMELFINGMNSSNKQFDKRYIINYNNPELILIATPDDRHERSEKQNRQDRKKTKPLLTILHDKKEAETIYTLIIEELNNESRFKNGGKYLNDTFKGTIPPFKDPNLIS